MVAFLFTYLWWMSVVVLLAYFVAMLLLARSYSRRFRSPVPLSGNAVMKKRPGVRGAGAGEGQRRQGGRPKKARVGLFSRKVKPANGNGNGKGKKAR